ncbi:MAG: hypothetical protein AAF763_02725 [Pseudomonadota bacterium]
MSAARIRDDELLFGVFDARGDADRLRAAFQAMSAGSGRTLRRAQWVHGPDGAPLATLGVAGPSSDGWFDPPEETGASVAIRAPTGEGAAAGRLRLFPEEGVRADLEAAYGEDLASAARFWRSGGFDGIVEGPSPLEGEFALACIDAEARRLTLARDPAGIEQIHLMSLGQGACAFATSPHALLALPEAPADPDMDAIRLTAWTADEMPWRSAWPGILSVAPGSAAVVSAEGIERRRWWRPGPDPALAGLDEDAFLDAFAARAEAAAARWAADPDGRALIYSGGLDSSLLLAAVAKRFPQDAIPLLCVESARPAGAEDVALQTAAARRFAHAERIATPAAALDPLEGAEAAWRRAAAPNMDFFACAMLALARALRARGLSGGHGGFAGDFAVSVRATAAATDSAAAGRWGEAARLYAGFRAAGAPRRRFAWQLAAKWGPTRWATRRSASWGRPPAPFLPGGGDQIERWRAAGVDVRPPMAPSLSAQQAAGLMRTSAQWPFRQILGEGPGEAIRVSAMMLDTRLTSAAMAAPPATALHGGLDRGLARRALARLGFDEAALRGGKSPLAPEIWSTARRALAERREEMRAFQDLALWRAHVDQRRVDDLLDRVDQAKDVNTLSVLLRAWHFGRFARLAAERR